MDRRQKKTRAAIFQAFTELLAQKSFAKMTVEEIITRADVGRATFYAHFETKEYLLKEFCHELFCHIFDTVSQTPSNHQHIFSCEGNDSVFLHLIKHLENNDNHILKLFSGQNQELFSGYFKENLFELVKANLSLFSHRKNDALPRDLWISHITATFVETLNWWMKNGRKESAETVADYFYRLV
ncbi:MAG: TetR/AcrR family transcriptional regulator [Ruminococcaceae bacterium]|nr:TetR/AcrR family transcriptional regulator [Oscillospiraceae bacterium]